MDKNATELPLVADIHNGGHVALEDWMGGDLHIVNNARVSFDKESSEFGDNERGLLNFLMRNGHGSPWESVVFRFDIKAPLFVIREWQRHRISSFNEQSSRYSQIPDEFYVPDRDHMRSQVGKPGNYTMVRLADDREAEIAMAKINAAQQESFDTYHDLLQSGVAKEVARMVLPVGMYSRMKWTVNLRALLNFLHLRNHDHAQREIREYAEIVEDMAFMVAPEAMKAFVDNGRVAP